MAFPIRFFISNLILALLSGLLLLAKKGLKNQLTLRGQYQLWYVYIFALLMPFIPGQLFSPGRLIARIRRLFLGAGSLPSQAYVGKEPSSPLSGLSGITDFSTAAAASHTRLTPVLYGVWIVGMASLALFLLWTILKIYGLRKKAYQVTKENEPDLYRQFSDCCHEVKLRGKVGLYASCKVQSPVAYGWLKPRIIIPQDFDLLLSKEEIRYIFLHELQHCRHKDALVNNLVCIFQILYWFNPMVWYAFIQLRKDREIACDHSVIGVIGETQGIRYGYTLIRYAGRMSKKLPLSPVSTMGGNKNTIRRRILEIAGYKNDTLSLKLKSAGILAAAFILVCMSSPWLTACAAPAPSVKLPEGKWEAIDASDVFGEADGSFVLYDMEQDWFRVYRKEQCEKRVSPASTYKIYSGLFALEEGILTPEANVLAWDGTPQPFEAWEQDQTLDTAMKASVNWYFEKLDRALGISGLSGYYSRISYGNCDLTGGINSYWGESSLKISPAEQTLLLSNLLQNTWGFEEENIRTVKNALFQSDTPAGKLYGKTGTGSFKDRNINGWFVGFLEAEGRTYCFATNLQGSKDCTGAAALEITAKLLDELL